MPQLRDSFYILALKFSPPPLAGSARATPCRRWRGARYPRTHKQEEGGTCALHVDRITYISIEFCQTCVRAHNSRSGPPARYKTCIVIVYTNQSDPRSEPSLRTLAPNPGRAPADGDAQASAQAGNQDKGGSATGPQGCLLTTLGGGGVQ